MSQTLVDQLGEFAASVTTDSLPDPVVVSVPKRVLDIVGLALAALPLETSGAVIGYARDQGGSPQATAIGVAERLPAASAALVNGVLAHSLDYDDTHLPSILHPSASVVPASLAAAEAHGSNGTELVAAIAVGLEVCVRLGMAGYDLDVGQSTFFERGQHATSICGTLGGAAAAAKLSGLDAEGIANAIGVAASMASGIIEANRGGGTVKRVHCGWAAHSAVTAAELVKRGLTGPPTVLEGRFGFFAAFLSGKFDAHAITAGLGDTWNVADIHYKPYPANHFTHAAIDAAIELRDMHGVTATEIESLQLGVAAPTVRTIGEPLERKRTPSTGYEAQFSGPYAVAAALLGGGGLGLSLDDFTDALASDPLRRVLMSKVTVVADARCDALYPNHLPAVLTARLVDGRAIEVFVERNRGGPERPLTDDELAIKFRDNAARTLPAAHAGEIELAASHLIDLDDLSPLLAPTTHAKEK